MSTQGGCGGSMVRCRWRVGGGVRDDASIRHEGWERNPLRYLANLEKIWYHILNETISWYLSYPILMAERFPDTFRDNNDASDRISEGLGQSTQLRREAMDAKVLQDREASLAAREL